VRSARQPVNVKSVTNPHHMPTFRNAPVDLVVDVRSHLEYWLGHLPEAVCIPVNSIVEDLPKRPGVTTDSRILVYCGSGARSANAAEMLKSIGFKRVVDGGGIEQARHGLA